MAGVKTTITKKSSIKEFIFIFFHQEPVTLHDEIGSRVVWKGGEEIFPIC